VLRSLTDFAYLLRGYDLGKEPLLDISGDLAKTPSSPIGWDRPRDLAVRLFRTRPA
jgi:hypothetical protein